MTLEVSFIETMFNSLFAEYKYKLDDKGTILRAYVRPGVRKRLSTVSKEIINYYKEYGISENQLEYTSLSGLRNKFETYTFDTKESIIDTSDYSDRLDIDELAFRTKRYSWQNNIYDYLFDEKKMNSLKLIIVQLFGFITNTRIQVKVSLLNGSV
jgi:hypothetical protein